MSIIGRPRQQHAPFVRSAETIEALELPAAALPVLWKLAQNLPQIHSTIALSHLRNIFAHRHLTIPGNSFPCFLPFLAHEQFRQDVASDLRAIFDQVRDAADFHCIRSFKVVFTKKSSAVAKRPDPRTSLSAGVHPSHTFRLTRTFVNTWLLMPSSCSWNRAYTPSSLAALRTPCILHACISFPPSRGVSKTGFVRIAFHLSTRSGSWNELNCIRARALLWDPHVFSAQPAALARTILRVCSTQTCSQELGTNRDFSTVAQRQHS